MFEMLARDITAPYSAMEAWTYDRFIAPAVNDYVRELQSTELGGVREGGKVLDVGCGGGQNICSLAASRTDLEIRGVDLSPRQVVRAQRRAESFGSRVQVVEGSALDLPFHDGAFDLVVSIGSIKHWPDMALGVSECVRVLAPGGRLVIAEADRGCRLDDARAFIRRWRIPGPLGVIALAGFRTWVAGQGLDLEEGRELLAPLPVSGDAQRIEGTPFLVLRGVRDRA
jgi:SAM-dependent methyltransferase